MPRLLPFKDKYYALTDYMSHPQVKELETVVDELRSELAVKSTEMDKLKNENKTLTNKYIQQKGKLNINEDDPAMASQATVLDSLEQDPEVRM